MFSAGVQFASGPINRLPPPNIGKAVSPRPPLRIVWQDEDQPLRRAQRDRPITCDYSSRLRNEPYLFRCIITDQANGPMF